MEQIIAILFQNELTPTKLYKSNENLKYLSDNTCSIFQLDCLQKLRNQIEHSL